MQFSLTQKPIRRPRFLSGALRVLPLLLLNCTMVQVADAQSTSAARPEPSGLYLFVSFLMTFALLALLIGLFRPKTFAFLFKEKATRGRVCGTFGAALMGFAIVAGPLEPKPVAPVVKAQEKRAQSDLAKAQSEARAAEDRAKAAEARAAKAEKAAEKKQAEKAEREAKALVQAQTKARAERRARLKREPASLSKRNIAPENASTPEVDSVTEEISDVSSADAWVPDGGQESYRNPRTLGVLLAVQHVGNDSGPIVVKVGNNDFSTWGQTTVTLNYDLLASVKKASVVAQLNYFYSFTSLASGNQKTIPITAFRNAEGRAFDPNQFRLRRIFVESKTVEGRKTWDAHPS